MIKTPPALDDASLASDYELLQSLTDIAACTGNETPVTDKIRTILEGICDDLTTDSMGNLFATIKGTSPKTVMLDAHADEIGFQIVFIESDGFLRIAAIGGQNPRVLPGARVIVHSARAGKLLGIIGEKPVHHLNADEKKKTTEITSLFVDCGFASKAEADKVIDIGDFATLNQTASRFATGTRATGKAFDDRAGCWVLIRVLQWLKQVGPVSPTVTAVFSSQEEIGLRGASVAAFRVNPALALIVEVTHAMDYPGAAKSQVGDIKLGGGPVIPIGPNVSPKVSRMLLAVAKKENIAVQPVALPDVARNNARIIQITRDGIPVGLVTIPLRYMHTAVETLDIKDLHLAAELIFRTLIGETLI